MKKTEFTFIDLFAGLGGFHLAAKRLGGKCVFASEKNTKLQELYKKNFNIKASGDIRDVDTCDIPVHQVLFAGFPCQPFSKAGMQAGLSDRGRGQVFFEILRVVDAHRPRLAIFENVANFVKHDDGNTYERIKNEMEQRGYIVQYKQFSPHQFGIPQIRERIYMVCSLNGLEEFSWPQPSFPKSDLDLITVLDKKCKTFKSLNPKVVKCIETWQNIIEDIPEDAPLPSFPIWSMEFGATYPIKYGTLWDCPLYELQKSKGAFGCVLKGLDYHEIIKRVPAYASYSKDSFPKWKQNFIEKNREFYNAHKSILKKFIKDLKKFPVSWQKLEWNCKDEERNLWKYVLQFRASGLRVKRATTSPSLVAMTTTQVPIIGWEKRYMSPRECARLQSMDELEHLPEGGLAFKALGNAVNVYVVAQILEPLLQSLVRNR